MIAERFEHLLLVWTHLYNERIRFFRFRMDGLGLLFVVGSNISCSITIILPFNEKKRKQVFSHL